MTETKTHTFDWQAENQANTFLAWAVLTMMPGASKIDQELFEELSRATDKFTKCELGVTLSGVPIDAEKFIKRLDESMNWAVEREAKKMLLDRVPGLDGMWDALTDLEAKVKEHLYRTAARAGFEITDDDWRDRGRD